MFLTLLLSSFLTLVELNCENLFDTRHDVGKEDTEFLPDGSRHWTSTRYWGKLNRIGQEILSCSEGLPDLVALVEVENDSVLRDLTCRSLLRNAGYQYLMTASPDQRGVDVALLYQPASFRPLCYDYLEVPPLSGMRPTRDILYVQGCVPAGDTLHVFVVHSPSVRHALTGVRLSSNCSRNSLRLVLLLMSSSQAISMTIPIVLPYRISVPLVCRISPAMPVVFMARLAAPIAIAASGIPWIMSSFHLFYMIG